MTYLGGWNLVGLNFNHFVCNLLDMSLHVFRFSNCFMFFNCKLLMLRHIPFINSHFPNHLKSSTQLIISCFNRKLIMLRHFPFQKFHIFQIIQFQLARLWTQATRFYIYLFMNSQFSKLSIWPLFNFDSVDSIHFSRAL